MLVTVDNKFQDKFSGWAFGQLLELDDFSIGFNGAKTNFLITRTETTKEFYSIVAKEGSGIILQNNFLIFMNDVLQKPGVDYEFNGGTRLKFKEAPRAGSNFKIYFYTGSEDDFLKVDIDETIKRGDRLRLQYQDPFASQEQRVIYELIASDTVETETYTGVGINTDTAFLRPVEWTKQTSDVIIDGRSISKARNSLEPQYYPSTNIIAPVGDTDTSISVENAWSFEKIDNLGQTQQDVRLVGATGIGLTIPTVETIQQVTYEGDYGLIEDITEFASGESGAIDSLDTLKFRVIPDPEIFIPSGLSAANKVTSTGISTGDYFVVRNTRIGSGVTSIDGDVSTVVANGADFIDNVYRASNVVAIAGTDAKLVSANVLSVVGVNTALPDNFNIKKYGNFSWGKIITGSRNGSSFVFQKDNPLSGVTTSAHVSRITELKAEY